MGHNHAHHHHATKNIALAFFLNVGFTIFEFIGGFYVNSVAIISDAVHDLGDSLSLGLSWYLQKKSTKGVTKKYTFGYKRFSLLGALINSIVLILGSMYVVYEAVNRIISPEETDAKGMFFFAIIGVAVNGFAAYRLSKGKSMNEKVLSWHLIEDVLGWASILIISIIIYFWEFHVLDPVLSLLIAVFILFNVYKRLKETMFVFLQGAPEDVNLTELNNKLLSFPEISSTHHTHIWSLDEENKIFSIHVIARNINSIEELIALKNRIRRCVKSYHINHATIDVELSGEECGVDNEAP
ncbi:MAG: cation diffusion facilitator family transporter [Cytophagaceae bacterium]